MLCPLLRACCLSPYFLTCTISLGHLPTLPSLRLRGSLPTSTPPISLGLPSWSHFAGRTHSNSPGQSPPCPGSTPLVSTPRNPSDPSTLFHHRSPLHPSIAHPHPASQPFGHTAPHRSYTGVSNILHPSPRHPLHSTACTTTYLHRPTTYTSPPSRLLFLSNPPTFHPDSQSPLVFRFSR